MFWLWCIYFKIFMESYIHTYGIVIFVKLFDMFGVHSASWVQLRSDLKEKVAAPI
jgi:hypothetical protein